MAPSRCSGPFGDLQIRMTNTAKIGTIIGVSIVMTAACLLLTSVFARCSPAASVFSMKLFFPFFGLTYYLHVAQPIPSALLLFLLVYLQFPSYAALTIWGWAINRPRRAFLGVALLHLVGVLAVFGAGLYLAR